jgi:hypothetical protein
MKNIILIATAGLIALTALICGYVLYERTDSLRMSDNNLSEEVLKQRLEINKLETCIKQAARDCSVN